VIDGVKITEKNQIFDERGKVMHMIKSSDPEFNKFGEIYFSCINPGVIKAWHIHKKMTLNYIVLSGQIKFVIFDSRKNSNTFGQTMELFLGPENYKLVTVPPNVWNGFKGLGDAVSIVANCSDYEHDDNEIEREVYDSPKIPYDWNVKFS
jgi:dTDP-4-dehydrorhamnose 3,5-epimerase